VYELGRFPDQRPYFTMKLVRGQTLAKLLKDRPDPASERPRFLKVFEQICQTLAYAHARKVLHRDLKPHNIMVGSFGEVQVMDWGLAKVMTGSEVSDTSSAQRPKISVGTEGSVQTRRSSGNSTDIPNTQAGSVMGTPAYMAPEQARGDIDQLDERADVFGLGAILCEILTGKPPYVGENGMEIYRQAVDADLADAHARLQCCGADDELITLAKRSLSANRDDRPRDASVLTNELTGYLHSVEDRLKQAELTAVKATTKAEEESKRRKVTFRLAAGILLTLMAGLTVSLWQMRRAMAAEELAKTNEGKALHAADKEKTANELTAMRLEQIEKINNTVFDIFTEFDIRKVKAGNDPVEYVLAQRLIEAGKKLDAKAIHDPLVLANLQNRLGHTLLSLGRAPQAIEFLLPSLSIIEARVGADHPDTLITRSNLASAYQDAGKLDHAIPLMEKTLKLEEAKFGPNHSNSLVSMNNLAEAYLADGKLDLALPLYERAFALKKAKFGPDHAETLAIMGNLAAGYQAKGQLDQALALHKKTLELKKATFGPDHPETLTTMGNLATAYQATGNLDQALPLLVEVFRLKKIKLGPDHPGTLNAMGNLATGLQAAGKLDQAIPLLVEVLELMKLRLGPEHPGTLTSMNNLALGYLAASKLDLAISLFEETLRLKKIKLGTEHTDTLAGMANLASGYRTARKFDLALPLDEETFKLRKTKLGLDHPDTLSSMNNLATGYLETGKLNLAIPLFEETLRFRKTKLGPNNSDTLISMNNLANGYKVLGKFDLALPLFEETHKLMKAKLGSNHPNTLTSLGNLGKAYCETKQGEKAEVVLKEFVATWRTQIPKDGLRFASILAQVAIALLNCNQFAAAEEMLRECLAIRQKRDPDSWTTFNTQTFLGTALQGQKKFTEAEQHLLKGYEGMKQREAMIPPQAKNRFTNTIDLIIQLYAETNKPDEVKKWQAEKDKLSKPSEKK